MELDQDIISQMKQETDSGVNTATYVAAEKNPDQHAKVMTLAEQFGASSDYAEQAYEDLKKERERIDVANKINANVPKLKNFISNPDYAAVSKDDLDVLKRIELDVDGHSKLDQARTGFMMGLSKAFSGFNKVPGYLGNLSLLPENIYAQSQGKDPIQFQIETENSKYWDQEAEYYKAQNPTLQKDIGDELLSGSVERAADALVIHSMAQIPNLAVIIGSSIGGFGLGGLLYTGTSAAAEKSDELQKQGVGTIKGTSVGTANGVLEFVFEKIGTSKVFKSWQEAITKEFGKQTAKEFSKNFAKKMVSTYAIGATEEGLTQWSQDFVDYVTGISPDMKGAGMRAFGAAALGGFMETTMTAPSGVMAGYAEYRQSEQSKTNKNFFLALGEKTNESKLKERLPVVYKEYVEHLTKDGPVENVYISPEVFTEYFQSKKLDPGLMASKLGVKDELDRAIETGTDLKISTAAMAEKLAGTEHYAALANDVKFGPDQLSANEEATQRKDAEDMLKEQYEAAKADKTPDEIKQYEDSGKEVYAAVKKQLKEKTKTSGKDADKQAKIVSEFFITQGLNSKQMPMDLFKKYGLNIQSIDEDMAGEKIDTTEYFQSSPQSKKLGIKFSATKINNKISVNPLETVSVSAELVDSEAGKTAVVDALKTDAKYPGVSLDAIKSLEQAAARNGATSMSVSAKRLNLKLNDKVIQNYADAGFTMSVKDGEAFFVKKLDPVMTYNQSKVKADSLGFDTSRKMYHGGPAEITVFKTNPKGINKYLEGVYMAYSKGDASRYAESIKSNGGDSAIYEFYPPKGMLKLDSFDDVDAAIKKMGLEVPKPKKSQVYKHNPEMTNLMKMRLAVEKSGVKSKDVDKVLREKLIEAGFTGLDTDSDQVAVVFDPKNVKSVDAAFDEAESGNIYSQQNRGSITFGPNRQFNINLFKEKNESTFLHESAHFFLEVMGDLATAENATEKSKQDYQAIMDFLDVKSRSEIGESHHEKFARSFEAYLMTGKTENKKLKEIFTAISQWLISIYKDINGISQEAGFKVEVSDEVKAIFDRMLVAEQMTEVDQMFNDPKLVMSEDETAAYLEASAKAKTEARDILQAELMQDLIRKKDKAYREKYDQLYAVEMEKAKAMPEFKVIEQITGEQKLSKPVIERDYAVFRDFLPYKSTQVDGGLHPDFVADLNGFENGQAMLQAIAPYRRGIESYVASQVVTQMKQEFPELLESPELSEEAIKAAHNKYAKRLKRLEMDFLYKKAQKTVKNVASSLIKRMPTNKEVRAQAVKIIASTKVSDLKPHLYRSAEKKYAKIAAQEFKKGNYDLAFEAKRKEYLNFELYDAAVDAKQDVEKAVKNFKKIFKKDEDLVKTRDIDLVNAARAILAHFGITKSEKTADAYLKDIKDYDPDTYSVVQALVNSATEKRGNYTAISYDDFSEMKNAVMAIWDLAKDRNEILIDGKAMKKQDAIDDLSAQADKLSTGKELPGYKKSITDSEKLGIQFLGALARYRKVEHWARAFDGGVVGAAMKYIFKPVSDAQVQFDLARVEVFKKLEALTPLIKGIDPKQKIDAPEINYQFRNKLELLHAILHTGNESNYEKLLIGRQWGSFNEDGSLNDSKFKSMINRLIADGTLEKSDFDFAQAIWDLNESLKPGAQRAHKKMYGHYFSDITAKPFANQFGNYRGGYMPAIADKTMTADKAVKEAKDLTEGFNNSFMFPTTGRGFSKSRVNGYFAPLELDLNKIAGHVNQVLKFTHIEPAIKQVAGIVSNKQFAASLFKVDPTIAREMLTPWLQRSATQRLAARGMSEGADRFFTALRSRSSLQFMAVNVPNWFQNMTSIFPVMNEVESKYIMGAAKDYLSDRHGFNEVALNKSDYMKTRAGETVRDVAKDFDQIVLEKTQYDKVRDAAKDYAMIGERVTNGIIEVITWNAAYREQIAKGKSEKDAVLEADSVVRRTIGDASPAGSSSVQALTPFGRLFTMMSGYFFNSGNQLLTEWQIAKQMGLNSKAGGRRAIMAFVMIVYAPAVMSAIIMKAFAGKGLDEDDDGEYFDDVFSLLFVQPLRFMTAMLPGGTIANTLINQFNDAPFDDRINVSPAASSTESAIRSVVSVPKAVFGDGDSKKALKDGLTAVGLLTGLPASFIGKPAGYLLDVKSGKANPAGPIDFTRGIITGKPGGK